ncbi:MAG TPA: biotin--[acetyl-CoA-carboxylase] ligase [Pyrinomonadaceae bacterium]
MRPLTFKTLRYGSLPSTNTELARMAATGAAEGLSLVAEEQTAGRGRMQRSWSSPKGAGLYFSVLLRPVIPLNLWPLMTFMAALAVGDALVEAFQLTTEIKWPNDLLAGERKICGILSETVESQGGRGLIVGIGVNLTREAYPPELRRSATSVAEQTGKPPDRERLLTSLLSCIAHWYQALQKEDGSTTILREWISRSPYADGKMVDVVNGEDVFRGVTRGLEIDGALRVETGHDEIRIVRAGDVVSVRATS